MRRHDYTAALVALTSAGLLATASCTSDVVVFSSAQGGGGATGGSGAVGGSSTSTNTGAGGGGCAVDCSTLDPPSCNEAVCNQQTGQCDLVSKLDGSSCNDGLFCTVSDRCAGGTCVGGLQNDCGLGSPNSCQQVLCNESNQSCSLAAGNEGSPCNDGLFCTVNEICQGGQCIGAVNDCSFVPPPLNPCLANACDEVQDACVPQALPNGSACLNLDPCVVNATCQAALCQGTPKDCSQLNGECTTGVCDTNGQCIAINHQNGTNCSDSNACTSGESCNSGVCGGGVATQQCINGDGCCPLSCNGNNDSDCNCTNIAPAATGTVSSGGQGGYGPGNFNDGVDQLQCDNLSCNQCFGWISNSQTPNGQWARYDWPGPVTVRSIYIDANSCNSACYPGRTAFSGDVQWFDGVLWHTIASFSGQNGDVQVDFPSPVTTTAIRVLNLATGSCGQASNTMIYEWYVYPAPGCTP